MLQECWYPIPTSEIETKYFYLDKSVFMISYCDWPYINVEYNVRNAEYLDRNVIVYNFRKAI